MGYGGIEMNLVDKVKELAKTTPFTENSIAFSVLSKAERGLPLNLQYFGGDGDGVQDNDPPSDGKDDNPDGNKDERTPEQIEFDKKVEAESDRKLNSALEKKQKEWEAQQKKAIADALAEKERLSKLSEKEREEEQLTQREKKIAEREAEIARKELRSDAIADLTDKSLPSSFADFLLGEDAEKTLENINNFKTAFDEAVNAKVKEKLRQDTPPAGGGGLGKGTNSIADLRNKKDQQQNKAPDLWA